MIDRLSRFLSAGLAGLLPALLAAAEPAPADVPLPAQVTLTVKSLTPKFLAFRDAALAAPDQSPDARWKLWQEKYNFAAVPPTPQGDAMARSLLDGAWARYAEALPLIENAGRTIDTDSRTVLGRVGALLALDRPLALQVLLYVGGFEGNAFTSPGKNGPVVVVPAEIAADQRTLLLAHETTHAAHIALGNLNSGWERGLAEIIVSEGLAMRVAQAMFPGRPDKDYCENQPGWLAKAHERRAAIFAGLLPHLEAADGETVFRFTMGQGPAGLEREAYYAGWLIVGEWLAEGRTLADIARIPRAEMPARVRAALTKLAPQP